MKQPRWLTHRALLLLHEESLAEHGGLPGVREQGLLESALARPRNKFAYSKSCDLADLAAAYAYGLSRNHPFRDGNKRIAFLSAGLFLEKNGKSLTVEPMNAIEVMFALAAGKVSEAQLAEWIREHMEQT